MAAKLGGKGPHQGQAESAITDIRRKSNSVILNADPETAASHACNAYEDFAPLPLLVRVLEGIRGRFVDQQRDRDGKSGFHYDVIGHNTQTHSVGKGGSQALRQRLDDIGQIDRTIV
jgi:hypothetical protein